MEFETPRAGTYRVGLAIEAPTIAALAPGQPRYSAEDLQEAVVIRYPYDWSYAGKRNVLNVRPRLVMPGVLAGGQVYLVETHELMAVRLEAANEGRTRALLLAHRVYNDGGDAATADLELEAGERVRLRVRVFDSIAEANRARFGPKPRLTGRMMQVAYRGWTATRFTEQDYRRVADKLQGVYDCAIIREVETHDWIPPIFHERGIKALSYQYLGALRRYTPQAPEGREAELGMMGAGGELHTAPKSPGGAWLLCDLRRPEMRDLFVQKARAAIEAGFDGVFLDGYPFWADATGRRGGNAPNAMQSLAHARWELLRDTAQTVHEANPEAVLGVLANQYYDSLGEADFVLKERMYFAWDEFAREFDDRRTSVAQDLDLAWEQGEAPYVAGALAHGVKGYSPISVQSAVHFLRRPTGLLYLGTGDFTPARLDEWLETVVALAREDDLYIAKIEPAECAVHFEGRSTIWADEDCTIELSRSAWLTDETGECQQHQVRRAQLVPERRYQILRECPQEVRE